MELAYLLLVPLGIVLAGFCYGLYLRVAHHKANKVTQELTADE